MKFTPEVIAAIETLRKNAENEFELHRISVLEKDLTAPPVVEIIDEKHQHFNGVTFRKTPKGRYNYLTSIHREVYKYYHGEIPTDEKYVVHHKNVNPSDNQIENLELLTQMEHSKIHSDNGKETECICTECGKKFIVNSHFHAKKYCSKKCFNSAKKRRTGLKKICPVCNKTFFVLKINKQQRCCSVECAKKMMTQSRLIKKTCPICGMEFTTKRQCHNERKTCSSHCAAKLRNMARSPQKIEKNCPICGKIFTTTKGWDERKTCSPSCARKVRWHKSPKQTT